MEDQVSELFSLIIARQDKQALIRQTLIRDSERELNHKLVGAISDNLSDDVETMLRYARL